jgi:uncharacterized protein YciI
MNKQLITCIILSLSLIIVSSAYGQEQQEKSAPETFEMVWEGQPVTMQKYFIIFLKEGPNREQPEEEAKKIQSEHLAYLGGLFKQGVLNLNGPIGDESDIAGISVYNTATMEEAIKLAEADPAVKAGRLVVEAHPWWLAKGSSVK